jgi:hypothetical protein
MEGSVKEDYCVIIAECAQDNMKPEVCPSYIMYLRYGVKV